MFYFYLGGLQLPLAPAKVQTKIKNQNKTVTLINGGEINRLKDAGLTSVTFDARIPLESNIGSYLNEFESLKVSKKPFQFKILRELPNGRRIYDTDMNVSLEEYTIKEDRGYGFDNVVTITLKQYKEFTIKSYTVNTSGKGSVTKTRETNNSPKPTTQTKEYTVKTGDTLWSIAKYYYGDGSKYPQLASANGISNPNVIQTGKKLLIPIL